MEMSPTIGKIAKALSQFQGEVKAPGKNAENPQFKSKYATLDDCIATIKETAPKYGLSYVQSLGTVEDNATICTVILHESGEWIKTDNALAPALQKRGGGASEFNAQGLGSSATYLRRYSLVAAFGLASEEDDDGNSTGGKPAQTAEEKAFHKEADKRQASGMTATLKAKWQTLAGSLDGFEEFYAKQQDKKYTDAQINAYLTKRLNEKKEEPRQPEVITKDEDLPF